MKVTLISPFPEIVCFGIRSLASYLELHGIYAQIIFLPDAESEERVQGDNTAPYNGDILNDISSLCQDSDIIGISLFSNNLNHAIQLTSHLKKDVKGLIVWGGKHPSAMPEMCFEYADIVAIGESEIPLVKLCNRIESGLDYFNVKGFWFKENGRIIRNQVGALVENLDEIPLSPNVSDTHFVWDKYQNKLLAVDLTVLSKFIEKNPFTGGNVYMIMTSRGCPFSCSYCYTYKNIYKGQKYVRRRSVGSIIAELNHVLTTYDNIDQISFADDEFMSAGIDYIREFCRIYKQKVKLPFHCLFHPATVTKEKLELLVDAGLSVVQMGIQTGSERSLKLYNRTISNSNTLKAVNLINQYKNSILPLYDFILDNPYEERADLLDTIKFIKQFPDPYSLTIFSLVFFPGTVLFNKGVEDKLIDPNKVETYLKKYQHSQTRYLNLIIMLMKFRISPSFIDVLISRPLVFIFDRPFFTAVFSYFMWFYKIFKKMTNLRRSTGGFEIDACTEKIIHGMSEK